MRVCRRWNCAAVVITAVTKSIVRPATFVITPFPEGVGGRGRMKGGCEWEREEGEGRRGKAGGQMRVKWPPPWGHMRGAFNIATLCHSLQMLTPPLISITCVICCTCFFNRLRL